MASSRLLTPAPTASGTVSSAAQEGVDMLWRHQLRKEHAALLEKLDASNKEIEAIHSETSRKIQEAAERICTLEARISRIESDEKKMKQATEKWHEEVSALKIQMGLMPEIDRSDAQAMSNIPEDSTAVAAEIPNRTPIPNTASQTTTEATNPSSTTSDDNPTSAARMPAPTTVLHKTDGGAIANARTTHPNTRSRSQSNGSSPSRVVQAEVSQAVSIPRLAQGTGSIKAYLKSADTAFSALPKDRQVEIQFVRQFIKGLRDYRARKALINELQKAHACRTSQDGKVDILCEWIDVAEGLRKAGLIALEAGEEEVQNQGAGRKRKKILIPRELIESGMMK